MRFVYLLSMFDIQKYGFELHSQNGELFDYSLMISDGTFYRLEVYSSLYSLYLSHLLEDGYKDCIYIFNRYTVKNQNELDFLILNGRAGSTFGLVLKPVNNFT